MEEEKTKCSQKVLEIASIYVALSNLSFADLTQTNHPQQSRLSTPYPTMILVASHGIFHCGKKIQVGRNGPPSRCSAKKNMVIHEPVQWHMFE